LDSAPILKFRSLDTGEAMRRTALIAAFTLVVTVTLTLATIAARPGNPIRREKVVVSGPIVVASKDQAAMKNPVFRKAYEENLAAAQEANQRYKGFTVKPHPDAKGENLRLQLEVAAVLMRLDYVPAHRVHEFRWIEEEYHTKITGYNGQILEIAPITGGVRVKLKVRPTYWSTLNSGDHTIEYYDYANGQIEHRGSEAPPSRGLVKWD
jgi:hypothetical protein